MSPRHVALVLVAAFVLAGCGGGEWTRADTAAPQREDDLDACRAEAGDRVWQAPWMWSPALAIGHRPSDPYPWGGGSRPAAAPADLSVTEGSYFQDCMRARGYELGPAR
jgi:hypothetical protein